MMTPPLLGRDREVDRLTSALHAHSQAGIVLVEGEPGCGKTSLLRAALAADHKRRHLSTIGLQSETGVDHAALAELLAPLGHELNALPSDDALAVREVLAGRGVARRSDLVRSVVAVISHVARREPVLLAIDDLHWVDDASAQVIFDAVPCLQGDPVVFVATARPGYERSRIPTATTITMRGLPHDAAVQLGESLGLVASVAGSLANAAAGNPLVILTAAYTLSARQRRGDEPLPEPLLIGRRLADAFARPVSALSQPARSALLTVALGEGLPVGVIESALEISGIDPAVLDTVDPSLLVRDGPRFAHPLVRSAVHESASQTDRRRTHAALADALRSDEHIERRALHLSLARDAPDDEVADALERAAALAAERGTWRTAASASEAAAHFSSHTGSAWPRFAHAGYIATLFCDVQRGRDNFEAAHVRCPDAAQRLQLGLARANACWLVDGRSSAVRAIEQIVVDAQREQPAVAVFAAMCAGHMEMVAGDMRAIAEHARRALRVLGDDSDPLQRLGPEFLLDVVAVMTGERSSTPAISMVLDLVRSSVPVGPSLAPDRSDATVVATYAAVTRMAEENWKVAIPALQSLQGNGAGWGGMLADSVVWWIELLWRRGEWNEAFLAATDARSTYRDVTDERLVWLDAVTAKVQACLGRAIQATSLASTARALAERLGLRMVTAFADHSLALAAMGSGDWPSAAHHLDRVDQWARDGSIVHSGILWWRADHVEALARSGRTSEARWQLDRWADQASGLPPTMEMAMARCRALLDHDEAAALEAIALGSKTPARFERARCHLVAANLMEDRGCRIAARKHIATATRLVHPGGAGAWMLDAYRPGDTAPTLSEWARLTDQEARVALAAARGDANKQVARSMGISVKTVEFHLSHVFRKLGVSSRVELALAVGRSVGATAGADGAVAPDT